MKFKKLAVANRGEVAVRIIRAAQELGIKTVLLHSEADKRTLAFREADENICIGPSPSAQSYLHIQKNIDAALSKGCDAIHPGFGFLSENADFASSCEKNRLVFIGPTPDAIRTMGDKVTAKSIAHRLGILTIPGYDGDDKDIDKLKKEAAKIGFPVLVKASGGGGGRGLKVSRDESDFEDAVNSAKREAQASFGNSRVFLEKYFEAAKHIEVQIFGDHLGRVIHLGERECSVQRRHQKIIEESPSPVVSPEKRAEIGELSKRLGEAVKYRGAGTVEFLFSDGKFYFMEMNTRLQVEHPVTEEVFGVDLVKAQLIVAQGEPTPWIQSQLSPRGHSIECRIYAEDPYNGGIPSTGKILAQHFAFGPGRRFEIGFEPGDEVTSYYDSMIAKVIVRDENRLKCILKLNECLSQSVVFGVKTNIPLLKSIISHPDFVSGQMNTQFIAKNFDEGLKPKPLPLSAEQIKNIMRELGGEAGATTQKVPNPFAGGAN
jgi:acetyl-CoA carboxylase biotin carboxylase subunit